MNRGNTGWTTSAAYPTHCVKQMCSRREGETLSLKHWFRFHFQQQLITSAPDLLPKHVNPSKASLCLLGKHAFAFVPAVWGFQEVAATKSFSRTLLLHARIETLLEKPTFLSALQTGRVLIPCASFYERSPMGSVASFRGSSRTRICSRWPILEDTSKRTCLCNYNNTNEP